MNQRWYSPHLKGGSTLIKIYSPTLQGEYIDEIKMVSGQPKPPHYSTQNG
jgi:hypothetical protein